MPEPLVPPTNTPLVAHMPCVALVAHPGEFEVNPISRRFTCCAHSHVEVRAFLLKVAMTVRSRARHGQHDSAKQVARSLRMYRCACPRLQLCLWRPPLNDVWRARRLSTWWWAG